ncbi:hypothetical protein BH09GEM1_BH09GEM1_30410 [soil metagenome]
MMFLGLVAFAAAFSTWILGWWGVAIVAIIAGALNHAERGRPWRVALGCLMGWALLMLVDLAVGPLYRVTKLVSGAMSISAVALILVTLLFPALIGWSGATLGARGGPAPPPSEPEEEFIVTQYQESPDEGLAEA